MVRDFCAKADDDVVNARWIKVRSGGEKKGFGKGRRRKQPCVWRYTSTDARRQPISEAGETARQRQLATANFPSAISLPIHHLISSTTSPRGKQSAPSGRHRRHLPSAPDGQHRPWCCAQACLPSRRPCETFARFLLLPCGDPGRLDFAARLAHLNPLLNMTPSA